MESIDVTERISAKSKYVQGDKFNRLTILSIYKERRKPRKILCDVICECGKVKAQTLGHVVSGEVKSCGCLYVTRWEERKEETPNTKTKEGKSWLGMKNRCMNEKTPAYKNYGGRGITVCEEWKNSFKKFFEDMGKAPTLQHSIDRMDNNGNYCKENCRWATPAEQSQNRRNNISISLLGEIHTLSSWARLLGMPYYLVHSRVSHGWPISEALFLPRGRPRGSVRNADILGALL
jgi:hypothetical protein